VNARRRLACAALALATAGILFRAPLAAAVVTRGDDALRNGDIATALRSYRKAMRIDPGSVVAADRLAFELALRHRRTDADAAIELAGRALQRHPLDAALLADRAFAELELNRWDAARADFRAVAALTHDPRYHRAAERIARRTHRPTERTHR
jgi:tetratricopeptide (TPR) repeat protein